MSHLVILDNEAIQAISDRAHRKHVRVFAYLEAMAQPGRGEEPIRLVVPTSVRVEAGWDRTARTSAIVNRLGIADITLDAVHANVASKIRVETRVSVVDAHLGSAMQLATADRVTVITSDPNDMRAMAGSRPVTVVAL